MGLKFRKRQVGTGTRWAPLAAGVVGVMNPGEAGSPPGGVGTDRAEVGYRPPPLTAIASASSERWWEGGRDSPRVREATGLGGWRRGTISREQPGCVRTNLRTSPEVSVGGRGSPRPRPGGRPGCGLQGHQPPGRRVSRVPRPEAVPPPQPVRPVCGRRSAVPCPQPLRPPPPFVEQPTASEQSVALPGASSSREPAGPPDHSQTLGGCR